MDTQAMRHCTVYNTDKNIEAVLRYKNWTFDTDPRTPPAFSDTHDPVIQIKDTGLWIKGLLPLMGYLDRRCPLPRLLPDDPDQYALVAMLLHGCLDGTITPEITKHCGEDRPFLAGKNIYAPDVLLAQQAGVSVAHWDEYRERVLNFVDAYAI